MLLDTLRTPPYDGRPMAKPKKKASEKPEPKAGEPAAPGYLTFQNDVAWLVLDDPAKRVNTLSSRLFGWFEEQLERLERERPRAVVVVSGKKDGFVAGADVGELGGLSEVEQVLAVVKRGHRLSGRFAGLPMLKVAAIHGASLSSPGATGLARYSTMTARTRLTMARGCPSTGRPKLYWRLSSSSVVWGSRAGGKPICSHM
jgi:hypothetical protein